MLSFWMTTLDLSCDSSVLGRCVCNDIKKFLQFQLPVNVAALIINFVTAVSLGWNHRSNFENPENKFQLG